MRRDAEIRIAHHPHRHLAPECDAVDLFLDRAGVGVDQDTDGNGRDAHRTATSGEFSAWDQTPNDLGTTPPPE